MKNFIFFIFSSLLISLSSEAQRVGNGGDLTLQQTRSILQKLSEAIQYSIALDPALFDQLAKNSKRLYSVNSAEYASIKNRILILPSNETSAPQKQTLCLVAQLQTFKRLIEEDTTDFLLENITQVNELSISEKTAIKGELAKARDNQAIPPHCQFEYP